uniref:histone acetyltransferase n=1 Tax=Plectus sambesii TaxID=2011161 RepID=A0A914UIK5_9BILA
MEEPSSKKPKMSPAGGNDFEDGLDGLDELVKMEPLPSSTNSNGMDHHGGMQQQQPSHQQVINGGMNVSHGLHFAPSPAAANSQNSVLQGLLLNNPTPQSSQGANSAPMPSPQRPQLAYNLNRSPAASNASMMSPPPNVALPPQGQLRGGHMAGPRQPGPGQVMGNSMYMSGPGSADGASISMAQGGNFAQTTMPSMPPSMNQQFNPGYQAAQQQRQPFPRGPPNVMARPMHIQNGPMSNGPQPRMAMRPNGPQMMPIQPNNPNQQMRAPGNMSMMQPQGNGPMNSMGGGPPQMNGQQQQMGPQMGGGQFDGGYMQQQQQAGGPMAPMVRATSVGNMGDQQAYMGAHGPHSQPPSQPIQSPNFNHGGQPPAMQRGVFSQPGSGHPPSNMMMPSPGMMDMPMQPMNPQPSSNGPPHLVMPVNGGMQHGQAPPNKGAAPTMTQASSAMLGSLTMNGPPSAGPQGAAGAQSSQDPEKRKLIQQQLVLLLHAHKCQQREKAESSNGQRMPCNLPHCSTMKDVLQHMTTCNNGRACGYAHCASSRQIISHWKNCSREDCPVCKPLKTIQNAPGGAGDRRQVSDTAALNMMIGGVPPDLGILSSNGPPQRANSGGPLSNSGPMAPFSLSSPGTVGANLLNDYNPPSSASSDPFRSPNPPNKVVHPSIGGKGGGVVGTTHDLPGGLPPPDAPATAKDWHQHVTKDLRNHLVGKLVKAIFPSPDPAAIHDQRIRDLIAYARKVEKEMFEVANDREEYYHLLAEKIYKIQKELQEKKIKRLNEAHRGGPNDPPISVPNINDIDMPGPPNKTPGPGFNSASLVSTLVKSEPGGSIVGMDTTPNGATRVKPDPDAPSADVKPSTSAAADGKVKNEEPTPEEKTFLPDELRAALRPIWEKLEKMDDAIPFRVPVDPELLSIPDYFEIVKKPMDLSTIKEKLDSGDYKNPWEFCDDMWLMFENAW